MKKLLFFALAWMTIAVSAGTAWADDIRLGPGDVLKISVYNNPDLSIDTRVDGSGVISYPLVGSVKVGGLTPSAAEKKIADRLQSGGFVKDPQVNIMVSVMESQQVSVLGQVNKPGRFPIDGTHSLTDVLAMAGGLTPDAGYTITLLRPENGKTHRENIDLYNITHAAGPVNNPDVMPGDTIYVERAPQFYIYGEVQRPGTYRIEHNMSVVQALSVGGGLSIRGTENGIRIKRSEPDGQTKLIDAHLEDKVMPNDVIYVKESLF